MDTDTDALLKVLQGGPHDEETLAFIRDGLEREVSTRRASGDPDAVGELVDVLEGWAEGAAAPLASGVYADCGQLAETELGDPARAQQLFTLAIDLDPENVDALERLQVLLVADGQHDRLEAVLTMQATALRARPDAEPDAVAYVWALLGFLYAEHGGDLDRAIEAYERALELCPDIDTMSELAGVYMLRNVDGDATQAAELYCALGDVLEGDERVVALQLALDNQPDHTEAMELLEETLGDDAQGVQLVERWRAYLAINPDGPNSEGRRRSLANALVAAGDHEEALVVLRPLSVAGNEIAQHMRENILQGRADSGDPIRPSVPASRSGHTQVGFKLPEFEDRPATRQRHAVLAGVSGRLRASLGRRPSDPPPRLQPAPTGVATAPGGPAPVAAPAPEAARTATPVQPAPPRSTVPPADEPASDERAEPGVAAVSTSPQAPTPSQPPAAEPALAPLEHGSLKPIALPADKAPPGGVLAWDSVPPPWRKSLERARANPATKRLAAGAVAAAVLGVAAALWISAGGLDADAATAAAAQGAEAADGADGSPPETAGEAPTRKGIRVVSVRRHMKSSGGTIPRAELARAIRRTVPRVERCYRRALKRNPALSGRVNFALQVKSNGRVADVKRGGGSIRDRAMVRCAVSAIGKVRFPKPKGEPANVSFRLRFRNG